MPIGESHGQRREQRGGIRIGDLIADARGDARAQRVDRRRAPARAAR